MSLYLSRLVLNPHSRQVQSELRDPYQMHRTLSRAFGDDPRLYRDARCLFRVDEDACPEGPCVLVQSRSRPDLSRLQSIDSYLASEPQSKELTPSFRVGQKLQFRLRANPTVKRDGRRLGLYAVEEQEQWLERKARAGGFRVLFVRIRREEKLSSRTGERQAVFAAARFDGVLVVIDPDLLVKTIESGIGSAKGFGFGLLSVAPAR